MSNKFSMKSMTDVDTIIYVAPMLVAVSLFHIFSSHPSTRFFGQIEIFAAMGIIAYYLWVKIPTVYDFLKITRKRIEAMACFGVGLLSALLLMPPLLTWQLLALLKNSPDKLTMQRPVLIAVVTVWAGCGLMIYGSVKATEAKMQAAAEASADSSMPTAPAPSVE
jgi:hypothetical protein